MTRPRVLIADDHKIVVEGLKRLLKPDFDIVGIVEDGRELVTAVEKLRPDVIVVDISMPMLNGIDAVRQIKKAHNRDQGGVSHDAPRCCLCGERLQGRRLGLCLESIRPLMSSLRPSGKRSREELT